MKIDMNAFAKKITLAEGKKVKLSIAQVKEVIRLVFLEIKALSLLGVVKLIITIKRMK
jgi:hypothetical protein